MNPDDLLTTDEVAAIVRVPPTTLRSWRHLDRGPQSFKLGVRVVYARADVDAWLIAQKAATSRGDLVAS